MIRIFYWNMEKDEIMRNMKFDGHQLENGMNISLWEYEDDKELMFLFSKDILLHVWKYQDRILRCNFEGLFHQKSKSSLRDYSQIKMGIKTTSTE